MREKHKIEAEAVYDGKAVEIRFYIGLEDFGFKMTRDQLNQLLKKEGQVVAAIVVHDPIN